MLPTGRAHCGSHSLQSVFDGPHGDGPHGGDIPGEIIHSHNGSRNRLWRTPQEILTWLSIHVTTHKAMFSMMRYFETRHALSCSSATGQTQPSPHVSSLLFAIHRQVQQKLTHKKRDTDCTSRGGWLQKIAEELASYRKNKVTSQENKKVRTRLLFKHSIPSLHQIAQDHHNCLALLPMPQRGQRSCTCSLS